MPLQLSEIKRKLQEHLQEGLLVVVGTGLSIAEGIPGMKVGGRRQLTIPPEKAYGPAGGGHRLSGQTLVFVIDLLGVR